MLASGDPFVRARIPTSPKALAAGAGSRIRTDDLLITNQLLYQLSYAGERRQKEVTRVTTLRWKRQKDHCNFCSCGRLLKTLVALFADARVSGKRPGGLQIFDHRAEID